jgi:CRISPR type IV-associated protein Csf2
MSDVVINCAITTVGPLSIRTPLAEGSLPNRFENFPVMTRGLNAEGQPLQTGYLPATTLRGFLRRAIVTDAMAKAAENGQHYTLQRAYADLIGQDAESEKSEGIDLLKLRELRESNPVLDLFGSGLGIKSRLLVSHFVPAFNVLPEVFTGVRKDLEDTDDVVDMLSEADRTLYFGRNDANSRRAAAAVVVRQVETKIRKAKKEKAETADLDAALIEAKAIAAKYEAEMGEMTNSSRTLTSYWALPAGIELKGRMVVQRARDRDIAMLELALDALSRHPVLGAQSARGCGEIAGVFDFMRGGVLAKRITTGGWAPAAISDFLSASGAESAA